MRSLLKPIDNAPLIIFRIFLGFLLAAESFGAILTGWVKETLVAPAFTFNHIGMDWLQPLPGMGMYYYFALMGLCGLGVMFGYRYRLSIVLFTLLWAGVYFMQKSSYNNHYYLLLLVCFLMIFMPAHRYASLDVKQHRVTKQLCMPYWVSITMIGQMAIVYFFATIAKFYPDWLDGTFTRNLFAYSTHYPIVGKLFTKEWFPYFIAYSGILFDGLVIPALLWKRTRNIALIASLIFHLFNSITLQIGIFPYFALSFAVFFYPTATIKKIFFKHKPEADTSDYNFESYRKFIYAILIPYFVIQMILPLRHWFIKGDVLWTEEGHRLSWRMMLRQRSGTINFKVVDLATGMEHHYDVRNKLPYKQYALVSSRPDGIWQMAKRIQKEYQAHGMDIAIYVDCEVSVNGKPYKKFIDPKVDFTQVSWNYFWHNDWILLYDKENQLLDPNN